MKISYTWLQKYFKEPLPPVEEVADALTFHVFEIEEQQGDMLEVKVLPDRAPYGLSHRGVAREVAAAFDLEMVADPLRMELPELASTSELFVEIDDAQACTRYMGALVRGVTVGPSPLWLQEALASVGQRSINNVVDATNYVMLNIGQPLHAFDAGKLASPEGTYGIRVRSASLEEHITTLTGEDYILPEGTLLITDAYTNTPLGIAGVKGGVQASVTTATTDIIIESANFNGPMVRKASQQLRLWTDASQRFQNSLSPTLAAYGMRDVLSLILDIAGGTLVGVTDIARAIPEDRLAPVSVTLGKIRSVLGIDLGSDEVGNALDRLGISFMEEAGTFVISPSFERRDLCIPEDIIEEVGRTIGYDRIPATPLLPLVMAPDQSRYWGIERIKDFLAARGFTEISTQSFAQMGDIELANPLQLDRPWLRRELLPNLEDALTRAQLYAPRVQGPVDMVKLFEIGSVFTNGGEHLSLALGVRVISGKKARAADALKEYIATLQQELFAAHVAAHYTLTGESAEIDLSDIPFASLALEAPRLVRLGAYQPFSIYPAALRDVAVWTPEGTEEQSVADAVTQAAGVLLVRIDCFDRFLKDGRQSFAFRLVFESMERTLSDADLDPAMAAVTDALHAVAGFEVR